MPDIHIHVPTFSQLTIKRITQYVLQGISTQQISKSDVLHNDVSLSVFRGRSTD